MNGAFAGSPQRIIPTLIGIFLQLTFIRSETVNARSPSTSKEHIDHVNGSTSLGDYGEAESLLFHGASETFPTQGQSSSTTEAKTSASV